MIKVYVDTFSQGLVECEFIMGLYDTCQTLVKYNDSYKIVDNVNVFSKELYDQIKELDCFKNFMRSRRIDNDTVLRFMKDLLSQE